MGLLAKINRSVAEADPNGSVSPYCYVTCVSSDTEWKLSQQAFYEPGETPPPSLKAVLTQRTHRRTERCKPKNFYVKPDSCVTRTATGIPTESK